MADKKAEANSEEVPSAVVVSSDNPAPAPAEPVAEQAPTGLPEPETEITESSADSISWTASEFIAHEKTASWYGMLAIGAVIIGGLVYLVTKDYISVAVVVVAAILLGVYGSHRPRELEYKIDSQGLTIGDKRYTFNQFRSFSVFPEGNFSSIVFMPLKRFSAPISIFYAPNDEEKILAVLNKMLPFEQTRRDAVDSLMRRIRF